MVQYDLHNANAVQQTTTEVTAATSPKEIVKDPNGYLSFDRDGVLRSYDGDNRVIGYFQLNPTQISKMIDNMPSGLNKTEMANTFAGVDGTKINSKRFTYAKSR